MKVLIIEKLIARIKALTRQTPVEEKTKTIEQEEIAEIPRDPAAPKLEAEAVLPQKVSEPEIVPIQPTPAPALEEATTRIWGNAQTTAFLDALRKGKLTEINPVLDLCLKDGFAYPEADKILGTSGRATTRILESLAEEDILLKQPFEKLLLTAEGSPQIMPVERCPHCDSSDLAKGKVLEHFACGYVGLEDDFKVGLKYICPKCKRELKLIGTDYRSPGVRYRCRHCKEISPTPAIKWRCLKSGKSCAFDELQEVWLYSYRFNEAKKDWLEFELEPKAQLVDFLKRRGYEVEELAKITGRSGTTHTLNILATRDDSIAKHTIAMGILAAKLGEEEVAVDKLFDFDNKAYDIDIHDKVIVAIPRLSLEAKKFAERQRIRAFDAQDFRTLALGQPPPVSAAEIELQPPLEKAAPELAKMDPRAKLIELLQSHGYEVTENTKVKGRSGTEYAVDIYAQRNDVIVTHTIAAAISHAKDGHEVGMNEISQFDTLTYDAGIHDKVFIAIPKLSPEAQQFARHQRIKVLEAKDLDSLFGL
jgi:DNA-directed RNA polymerase subunit RPC12/RpoP